MSEPLPEIVVPSGKQTFKASEVCELLKIQPYVLRTWENEFKELGVEKSPGTRTYRRNDVERAVRIRQLVFAEGLTLAGARRRLEQERAFASNDDDGGGAVEVPAPETRRRASVSSDSRARLERAKTALRDLVVLLGGQISLTSSVHAVGKEFALEPPAAASRASRATKSAASEREPAPARSQKARR